MQSNRRDAAADPLIDTSSRLDRELRELLEELRVLLPGIQVLFAFLLTLPFTGRFDTLTSAEEALYFIAFCSTALATVLLITPGVQHRLRWRQHDKEHLLQFGNRYVIAGTAFLATAIVSVVLLVSEYLYGWTVGVPVGVVVSGMILLLWYAIPIYREATDDDRR